MVGQARCHPRFFRLVKRLNLSNIQRRLLPSGQIVVRLVRYEVQAKGLVQCSALWNGQSQGRHRCSAGRGREAFDQAAQREGLVFQQAARSFGRRDSIPPPTSRPGGRIKEGSGIGTADLSSQPGPVAQVFTAIQFQRQVGDLHEGLCRVEQVKPLSVPLKVSLDLARRKAAGVPLGCLCGVGWPL